MELQYILTISFLLISTLGTILHFTHNWFKNGILLHIFSAVNESTWEHMKLLVFPTLVVLILQYILLKDIYSNILNSILILYLVEIFTIPLLYEPLRIVFKRVHFLISILIFYIAILLGIYSQYIVLSKSIYILNEYISLILIFVLTTLFAIFTYIPPKIFLFRDPNTGKYGDEYEM